MILKVIIDEEGNQIEVFEITNYYTEDAYLEADIEGKGIEDRSIILNEGNYLGESENWEQIVIMTDKGFELLKLTNEVKK